MRSGRARHTRRPRVARERRWGRRALASVAAGVRGGEIDDEAGAAPRHLAVGELPPFFFDDAAREPEAEAGPPRPLAGREERVEDSLGDLGVDPGPVVGHFEQGAIAFAARPDRDPIVRTPHRQRLSRVQDEVQHHLRDPRPPHARDRPFLRHPLHPRPPAGLVRRHAQRALSHRPEVHQIDRPLAREPLQVANDLADAVHPVQRLVEHREHVLGSGGARDEALAENAQVDRDKSRRIVDLVRDAGREPPDAGETIRRDELGPDRALLAEVVRHVDDRDASVVLLRRDDLDPQRSSRSAADDLDDRALPLVERDAIGAPLDPRAHLEDLGARAAEHVRLGAPEQAKLGAVDPHDPKLRIEEGDPVGELLARRLPHHLRARLELHRLEHHPAERPERRRERHGARDVGLRARDTVEDPVRTIAPHERRDDAGPEADDRRVLHRARLEVREVNRVADAGVPRQTREALAIEVDLLARDRLLPFLGELVPGHRAENAAPLSLGEPHGRGAPDRLAERAREDLERRL